MKKFILATLAIFGLCSALTPVLTSDGTLVTYDTIYTTAYNGPQQLISTRLHYIVNVDVLSKFENMTKREGATTDITYYTPMLVFTINGINHYTLAPIPNQFTTRPLRSADGRYDFNGWSAGSKTQNHYISGFIDIPGNKAFIGHMQQITVHFVRPIDLGNTREIMYEITADIEARAVPVFSTL